MFATYLVRSHVFAGQVDLFRDKGGRGGQGWEPIGRTTGLSNLVKLLRLNTLKLDRDDVSCMCIAKLMLRVKEFSQLGTGLRVPYPELSHDQSQLATGP